MQFVIAAVLVAVAAPLAAADPAPAGFAALSGSTFVEAPPDLLHRPLVQELPVPRIPDGNAIWGATGRDARGHLWIGVSAWSPRMSAHLFEYVPATDRWHDRGSVVEELRKAGIHRRGEGQIKIHSKIVQAADGWLYFASTDEEGEEADGNALPRWGGHLWRIHPTSGRWQHLAATREGLVAVNGYARHVYALGYWNHVLYQYDTVSGGLRSTVVGSPGGHVSRNVVVDARGHAYVPRVGRSVTGQAIAELVEYDPRLRAVGVTPLAHYFGAEPPSGNHGITGLAWLSDGRLLFTTHVGHLYAIAHSGAGPARVDALGWFHPAGERYAPSLFALGSGSVIGGVTQRGTRFDWVVRDLAGGDARAQPLDPGYLEKVLLYGSISRDDAGRAYLAGWAADGAGGQRPLVLRLGAAADGQPGPASR